MNFIYHQLMSNQYAMAAVLGVFSASIAYFLRSIPVALFGFVKYNLTLDMRTDSDHPSYHDLIEFITDRVVKRRFSRNFIISGMQYTILSVFGNSRVTERVGGEFIGIGYGIHIGLYKSRLVFIKRYLESSSNTSAFKQYCSCTFLSRNQSLLQSFYQDMCKFTESKKTVKTTISLRTHNKADWNAPQQIAMRYPNTVFSSDNAVDKILKYIEDFDNRRESDLKKGLPHRAGILFTGVHGTGKSSMIHAVATVTGRDIYYLNMSGLNDNDMMSLISLQVDWNKILLVCEDFDAQRASTAVRTEDRKDAGGLSMSTILNCFDGVIAPDGVVFIATTNHPEKIDPAILRDGRFDLKIEVGPLNKQAFADMCDLFEFDHTEYDLPYFYPVVGATMRSILLKNGVKGMIDYQSNLHRLNEPKVQLALQSS